MLKNNTIKGETSYKKELCSYNLPFCSYNLPFFLGAVPTICPFFTTKCPLLQQFANFINNVRYKYLNIYDLQYNKLNEKSQIQRKKNYSAR
jgi:hypothetical protein